MRTLLAPVVVLVVLVGCASDIAGSSGAPPTGTTTTTTVPASHEPTAACGYCTVDDVEVPPCPDRR